MVHPSRHPVSARRTLGALSQLRLANSYLAGEPLASPAAVVGWFGAVQAQDFSGAKWALAQRVHAASEADVDKVFQSGAILRTHVLRPTWHFVLPADIRWLLALSAPRVKGLMAYYDKKLELDAATFRRSHAALTKALRGGKHLTREELARVLDGVGIRASGQRLGHLMMRAELDALICSGPRRGKQFTYALLDERAAPTAPKPRDEALAALAERYFKSHGPASAHDFAAWSGLTVTDARRGAAAAGKSVSERVIDEKRYYAPKPRTGARTPSPSVHLLPNYDEYLIALKDYTPVLDPALRERLRANAHVVAQHLVVSDGLVVGGWRRVIEKQSVSVEVTLLKELSARAERQLRAEAERFARFLGLSLKLAIEEYRPDGRPDIVGKPRKKLAEQD